MSINRGKNFEGVVQECIEQLEDVYILRLYDPQGGYAGVSNPCDFIAYDGGQMYMLECKALHGNTFSIFSNDPKKKYGKVSNTQWEGMLEATQHNGVVAGLLIWWVDKDVTRFIPIQQAEQLRNTGAKSIKYDTDLGIPIEGRKKRVYYEYDFENFFKKGVDTL